MLRSTMLAMYRHNLHAHVSIWGCYTPSGTVHVAKLISRTLVQAFKTCTVRHSKEQYSMLYGTVQIGQNGAVL